MTTSYKVTESLHCVNLDELMRGCKKIILQHGKRLYFLTITRKGNLILTSAESLPTTYKANDNNSLAC